MKYASDNFTLPAMSAGSNAASQSYSPPELGAPNDVQLVRTFIFTHKEARRLKQAVEHFVDSFGEALPESETLCFEDLGYRLAGVPDERIQFFHLNARRHDRQP